MPTATLFDHAVLKTGTNADLGTVKEEHEGDVSPCLYLTGNMNSIGPCEQFGFESCLFEHDKTLGGERRGTSKAKLGAYIVVSHNT